MKIRNIVHTIPFVRSRALLATLLIFNILMASRFSLSRSLHPIIIRHAPRRQFCNSRLAPRHLAKSYSCPLWSSSFYSCLQSPFLHKSRTTSSSFSSSCSFSSLSPPSASSMAAASVDDSNNPLLKDFEFPPFDVVEAEHVRPGIRGLLKKLVGFSDPFFS